ncbi:MAG TPA: hypothetical protein VIK52_08325 [Opitutaceae bacterium]
MAEDPIGAKLKILGVTSRLQAVIALSLGETVLIDKGCDWPSSTRRSRCGPSVGSSAHRDSSQSRMAAKSSDLAKCLFGG